MEKQVTEIIGGAEGPTSVFIAGKTGLDWVNLFGLFIIAGMLIPNVIYAFRFRGLENVCKNKWMNIVEQIGRFASMFLMVFNIGIAEFGFSSVEFFISYFYGNIILIAAYWLLWILFFRKQSMAKQMLLAIIPTAIFLLSGITLGHWLLVGSAVLFGIGHLYVTYCNGSYEKK